MTFQSIIINNQSAPKDIWETLLPPLLGLMGVVVGAVVANHGQRRRDRAAAAQGVRSTSLAAVTSVFTYLGSVSTVITFALHEESPDKNDKVVQATQMASSNLLSAQTSVAMLAGLDDDEVAKQGTAIHAELIAMDNEVIPLVRRKQFNEAEQVLEPHRATLERSCNILIFMVRASEQLQTSDNLWLGRPYFRNRKQATLVHDNALE